MTDTNEDKPLLKPKIDLIFKSIFGSIANIDILEAFLKSVLIIPEDEYINIEIVDPFSKIEKINDKLTIIDVKVHTTKGIINVEIQLNRYTDMEDRIIFGISKAVTNQKHSGNDYKLKKVITILITDYILIDEHGQYHDIFRYHSEKTGYTFSQSTEIHTLELSKLPEDYDNSNLWYWLKFVKSENEEDFEMLADKEPLIKKAYGVLKELSQDEQTRLLADAREAAEWDRVAIARNAKAEGVREGIKEGIKEEKISLAKKMLMQSMSLELIQSLTELPIEMIEKIKNKL